MQVITENILRKIIRETLLEMIGEGGTNMHSLYHFTHFFRLPGIINSGKLRTNEFQGDKRNGKKFISFTRHKSNLEGFAMARECDVRIEVDGQKLSSLTSTDVYPFEYYSPKRPWNQRVYGGDRTAKFMYQQARKARQTGECDYMHQAEESFETTRDEIDIENIVIEIDILVENNFFDMVEKNDGNIRYFLTNLASIKNTKSPLIGKTFVYMSEKDFSLQTQNKIPLAQFAQMILMAQNKDFGMRKAVEQ